jgi:hypothetical protein
MASDKASTSGESNAAADLFLALEQPVLDQVQQHGLTGPAAHLRHPVDALDQHRFQIGQDQIGHVPTLPEIDHGGHAAPSAGRPDRSCATTTPATAGSAPR